MKYWYDTEFIDDGLTIDLVSIGIVAEDGREYYAVSDAFDVRKLCANTWLRENVLPSLPMIECKPGCRCRNGYHLDVDDPAVRTRGQIARAVREFLLIDDHPELWSWYPSYDHVALAQLFGTMMDLPPGLPKRTNDVEQEAERLDVVGLLPDPPKGQHNALIDAKYHRQLYDFVQAAAHEQYVNALTRAKQLAQGDWAAERTGGDASTGR